MISAFGVEHTEISKELVALPTRRATPKEERQSRIRSGSRGAVVGGIAGALLTGRLKPAAAGAAIGGTAFAASRKNKYYTPFVRKQP